MRAFVLERVENIVGKGENAGNQHFLLFRTMFSKGFFPQKFSKTSSIGLPIAECYGERAKDNIFLSR